MIWFYMMCSDLINQIAIYLHEYPGVIKSTKRVKNYERQVICSYTEYVRHFHQWHITPNCQIKHTCQMYVILCMPRPRRRCYSIFQNQWTPSCLGAASPCLVWPRQALPCHALSCLVLSCVGLNVTLFRQIQKMGFIWWGCFNADIYFIYDLIYHSWYPYRQNIDIFGYLR